ncbi:hypothetical protein SeLEV6574_g00079 [Synchytrium endobioticum]|uniref:Lariat debranching enzyme C-terminal domain-containing protein n=1 Tax=Synchytrium endobioticum TaxID=286115 RepID=A0A507DJM2_9FUNG|nr:hypothetical protein SeLEV6574_g00079 [Synchytrium endobioticum]
MRIAVQGCLHGELDTIYQILHRIEHQQNVKVDLLIVCGDFQTPRNEVDLAAMSIKDKYRDMGTFWKYYSGQVVAPYPTLFIGGNHEASNYLYELYHGGWVAKNIYFMGFANIIRFGPLRIGGLSGIYNSREYDLGFYEPQPFNNFDKISIYHVRKFNVYRLAQVKAPLDFFLSHDWPRGIAEHGNQRRLLSIKKFLEQEIKNNTLGSFPAEFLLKRLKPAYWFSAHLHVKFAAIVRHSPSNTSQSSANSTTVTSANPDEIQLTEGVDDDEDGIAHDSNKDRLESTPTVSADRNHSPLPSNGTGNPIAREVYKPTDSTTALDHSSTRAKARGNKLIHHGKLVKEDFPSKTRFLSLDKVIPGRHFLQVMEFDTDEIEGPFDFSYDQEWLAVVKATNSFFSNKRQQPDLPRDEIIAKDIEAARRWVQEHVPNLNIPNNFVQTAPPFDPKTAKRNVDREYGHSKPYSNPQTVEYCRMLDVVNCINPDGLLPVMPPSYSPIKDNSVLPSSDPLDAADADPVPPTLDSSNDDAFLLQRPFSTVNELHLSNPLHDIPVEMSLEHETYHDGGDTSTQRLGEISMSQDNSNNDDSHDSIELGEFMEDDEGELLADDLAVDHGNDVGLGADIHLGFGDDMVGGEDYGDEGDPILEDLERNSSAD